MMQRLLPILFLMVSSFTYGQNNLLTNAISWFGKTERTNIDHYLTGSNYRRFEEKDSLDFHRITYSSARPETGTQPVISLFFGDSSLEFISFDAYQHKEQQAIFSQLKAGRFKQIGTGINGNFITTTYDNGIFLVHEDYEAVANPLGKGEIAYFRYRVFRKYGRFDTMNGQKTSFSDDGYPVVETYKNGVRDGERITYYYNKTIKRKEYYRSGRLSGLVSDFDEDGKLTHTSTHSYHWKYGMEKWYNKEGKVVKSVQWQRDVPVGTEKQTFNGKTVGSVSYVKGIKQGLAQVPIYGNHLPFFQSPHEVLDAAPLGIETVTYQNGVKSGKAVCMDFTRPADTLYTCYYKNGMLDSIYTKYERGEPSYTTTFLNDLENGTRIFRIPSGPLKDTIFRSECYKEGIPNGPVYQYYQRESTASTNWKKIYREENFQDGLRHGAFIYRLDSLNYKMEHFEYEKRNGKQEYGIVREGKTIRQIEYYEKGKKTGEWTTENETDNLLVTEHFNNDQKHGSFTKTVRGFKTEERFYERDTLKRLLFFEKNGNSRMYAIEFFHDQDSVLVVSSSKGSLDSEFTYLLPMNRYENAESSLETIAGQIEKDTLLDMYRNGPFVIQHLLWKSSGEMSYGKILRSSITHLEAKVLEKRDGPLTTFTGIDSGKPYSGTFISALNGEQISVKNGLRNGWSIESSSEGMIRKIKYKNGILKKIVETHNPG